MRPQFLKRTRQAARPRGRVSKEDALAKRRAQYKHRLENKTEEERREFWDKEAERTQANAAKKSNKGKRKRTDESSDDEDLEEVGGINEQPRTRMTQSTVALTSRVALDDATMSF